MCLNYTTGMEKILFNGLEEGGVYQMRTSEFKPKQGYQSILQEFDSLYESYQGSGTLFSVHGQDAVVVLADTHTLALVLNDLDFTDYSAFAENLSQLKDYLSKVGISAETSAMLVRMVENEDLSVGGIIEQLAEPGQTITVQCMDSLYGNNEYEINV